ncbi:eukaryotic translation initiation factor 2A [Anopheles stephensi]|uniref:eukaryotic translation initiation factor 2A n=1 Tax=Anopheles stephensi TaxID=30069 RepID=UPI0016589993|nr:eukaryotic translation initiation factor 2A [Anopheles stephensi]
MASGNTPTLALRSAKGVEVWKPEQQKQQLTFLPDARFTPDQSKSCRAIVYSPDGRFLAWANGSTVQLCRVVAGGWKTLASLPRPKACYLRFSPLSNYLMTWETYTENPAATDLPKERPNLFIYRADTGEEVFSIIQKRHQDWQMHWSCDETIAALLVGGEALFYEHGPSGPGFKQVVKRFGGLRNGGISVAPGPSPPHIGVYMPGTKGAPSMCRLFKYPNLELNQPVASKSFFQADKVDMMWNRKGTGLILMTSTDVDTSGVSYYGKQALHYMTPKGDSCGIQLKAEGPIHDVAWSPKSTEFCVVYGFMPARATLFNLKCDIVYDFEPGNRNSIFYNDFGNLVLFGGFGNLPGYIETWDLARRKKLASFKAPDTTLLEWHPAGDTFLTATTAPRLRMSNGFKVWHYSGALLGEYDWSGELLEVIWQKYPPGTYKVPAISDEKIEGIVSATPVASKQKYIPPGARGNVTVTASGETIDLRPPIPGLPVGYRSSVQIKTSRKNKKAANKAAAAAAAAAATAGGGAAAAVPASEGETGGETATAPPPAVPKKQAAKKNANNAGTGELANGNGAATTKPSGPSTNDVANGPPKASPTGDPNKDKKIKAIHKKLKDIKLLKEKHERGETLVQTQIVKMNSESQLRKELEELKVA